MKDFITAHLRQFLMLSLGLMIPSCVAFPNENVADERDKCDKHIIIAIQQNSFRQDGDNNKHNPLKDGRRDAIYHALCNILKNHPITSAEIDDKLSEIPDSFSFDPLTDRITLFSFGYDVVSQNATWPDFIQRHFTYLSSFPNDEPSFDSFIKKDLGNALQYHEYNSAFAYFSDPLILTRLSKTTSKSRAKEYYLFIVSRFIAGGALTSSEYDKVRIKTDFLNLSNELFKAHNELSKQIGNQSSLFDIWSKNTDQSKQAANYNAIKLRGHKVVLRALEDVDVFCRSSISLTQTSVGSLRYKMLPQKISFPNNPSLKLDAINLEVTDEVGNKYQFNNLETEEVEKGKDSYFLASLPSDVIELKEYKVNDLLHFKYTIYATALNNIDNSELLSYIIDVPTVDFTFKKEDLMDDKTTFAILISALIALLLVITLFAIWYYRGRLVKAKVNVKIDHISKQRYMNVSVNKDDGIHVTNAPCWYLRPGINEQKIHVTCSMERLPLAFARRYRIRLSYMVKDLDENYDFTFRPDGQENDGSLRRVDTWYVVPNGPVKDESKKFEFNAIAYVDYGKTPDFAGRENILKLGICFKAELVDGSGVVMKLLDERIDVPYEFIAKEYFSNRELWMAFDPGTSGSCVAYGYGGSVADKNSIHLARNFERHTDGFEGWVPIFPSKIRISDNSRLFINPHDVENAQIIQDGNNGDFWFGNAAEQLWGRNSFQSIKKLLGYSNELPIKRKTPHPTSQLIAGRDLAHLLVKGILNRFEMYLTDYSGGDNGTNDIKALEEVRPKFLETGVFQPSRAIVTVPNNFTLVKIFDMVESIRRTNKFKEVHFLYEAEGVLMTYLRENWSNLQQKEEKNIIVFDMGGATINASAFTFNVSMRADRGCNNIDDVTVRTVSRIGYGIGGDDIDYALIQILCSIPSVNQCIPNRSRFIREYKIQLLKYIKTFKLSYIDKTNNLTKPGNIVTDMATLWGSLRTNFKEMGIVLPENYTKEDEQYLKSESTNHATMNKYVLNNVKDAITELVNSPNIQSKNVEIIFSGRSTLYPGIQEAVMNRLDKFGFSAKRWDGFDKSVKRGTTILDDEKVKSAVAVGACWYAMWSQFITIRHDIVTSTFGFIDLKDNKEVFHPVVNQGETLLHGHRKHGVEVFNPMNPNIAFVQMLGSNFDEIWEKKIYHKMNRITQFTDIEGDVDHVEIDVDDKNNFRYLITEKSGTSHGDRYIFKDIDIIDENSEAYIYAAYISEEDGNEAQSASSTPFSGSNSQENTSRNITNKRGGGL